MYTLGDTWQAGKRCQIQPLEDAQLVLACATAEELTHLRNIATYVDADTVRAFDTANAESLAWHLAGGDDCTVTGEYTKRLIEEFIKVANRCRTVMGLPPVPGTTTTIPTQPTQPGAPYQLPPLEVTATNWTPYVLGAIGVLALVVRTKRGR